MKERGLGCVDCGGMEDWDRELDWEVVNRELSVGLLGYVWDHWALLPFGGDWTALHEFGVEEDDWEQETYIWWVEDWEIESDWWANEGELPFERVWEIYIYEIL